MVPIILLDPRRLASFEPPQGMNCCLILFLFGNLGHQVSVCACLNKTAAGGFNGVEGCSYGVAPRNGDCSRNVAGRKLDGKIGPLVNPDDLAETSKVRKHTKYNWWGAGSHSADIPKFHADCIQR